MQNALERYINKKSFWHNINPTVKLIIIVFLITIVFLPIGFFGILISTCLIILIWISAKLPAKLFKSIFLTWIIMFLLLGIINWIAYKSPGFDADIVNNGMNVIFGNVSNYNLSHLFTTSDGAYTSLVGNIWGGNIIGVFYDKPNAVLVNSGVKYDSAKAANGITTLYLWYSSTWYSLSSKVLINTSMVSFKIILMISIITILVSTTSNIELTIGIEDLLHPLSYLRIPVNEWAMTFAIAIRFVPSLLVESQNILRAQASRGVDFRNGNIKDKTKSLISLIVPMFSIAFHKADDLSNAMEARSYDPRRKRTRYRNYSVSWKDFVAIGIIGMLFSFFIFFATKHMVFGPFNWIEYVSIA